MATGGKRGRKAPTRARKKALAPKRTVAPGKSEVVQLKQQLADAHAQQAATAEILKVISNSPADAQPAFEAIVSHAHRLTGGVFSILYRYDDKMLSVVADSQSNPKASAALRSLYPAPPRRDHIVGRCVLDRRSIHSPDVMADARFPANVTAQSRLMGYRAGVTVPLLRDGKVIGAIATARLAPRAFTKSEISLLQTFADQAVIAIENVRLFNETKEALERQTATAEVLKVIASSPSNVQPVFDAILRSAVNLCGAEIAAVFPYDGKLVHLGATHNWSEEALKYFSTVYPAPPSPALLSGRTILGKSIVTLADAAADGHYDPSSAATGHWRRMLGVPMIREGRVLGALVVCWREPGEAPQRQIDLLQTFADQAVIAIENVRLFNETEEALERQTATADILKVIASSPAEVQPVFDAIVETAKRLIGAFSTTVTLVGDGKLHLAAHTATSTEGAEALKRYFPIPVEGTLMGRAVQLRQPEFVDDLETDPAVEPAGRDMARARGFRSVVFVPLVRGDIAIGSLNVTRREAGRFSDHHVGLLKTFAAQAVIAIENVRLFNETKDALERQTATTEILKVISSSPTDLNPVFEEILDNAVRLCDAHLGILNLFEAGNVRTVAQRGANPEVAKWLFARGAFKPENTLQRMIAERRPVHVPDLKDTPAYRAGGPITVGMVELVRARTFLVVPLLLKGEVIGNVAVYRPEVRLFSEKQIALVSSFADQAVIAIENVRLFNETKESLDRQTATAEILKVISSSPTDTRPVFEAIAQSAGRLLAPATVALTVRDGGLIRLGGYAGPLINQKAREYAEKLYPIPFDPETMLSARAMSERRIIETPDTEAPGTPATVAALGRAVGFRSNTQIPLMRDGQAIGSLTVAHPEPGFRLNEKQLSLMKTFADQAVIAIENVRLFHEIEEKGKQLEQASQHKSNFLASMSHELRTPLNAILGFNEMIIGEVYGEVPADMQEPLNDIQASGKHLLRLINNVLDLAKIEAGRMELSLQDYSVHDTVESVRSTLRPLAADKGLEFLASVPADIPLAHGDGGRITQCLMNLAGNSLKFTKAGKVEISVEAKGELLVYRVTDTGIGIPPDKIGSLFTEFKQTDATIASEYGGTGLGLSISRKFVEMHGGRIWVESELGKGSAFIFEVPLRAKMT
jgi:GAF domain-containing protein